MRLVVDTNRLIAALIKNGASRSILKNTEYNFFTPEFALEEIWKYKSLIQKKAGISEQEFSVFLFLLSYKVKFISSEEYTKQMPLAVSIMGHIDKKDVPFIAVALALNASIWSDDEHFVKQNKVKIFKTEDLL